MQFWLFILVQTVKWNVNIFNADIIKKTFTLVPWTLPAPLGASLSTMDIKAIIWIIINNYRHWLHY